MAGDTHFLTVFPVPIRIREKVCVLTENPNLFVSQEDLIWLLEFAYPRERDPVDGRLGDAPPVWKELPHCGLHCKYRCANGHDAYRGINRCRLHFDPNCHTEKVREVARLELSDLVGEERYMAVWFTSALRYPTDLLDWRPMLNEWRKRWFTITKRVGDRKKSKGKLYYRSMSVYYAETQGLFHFKVLLKEDAPVQMAQAVQDLANEMRAIDVRERRYWKGEDARLQVMMDSMSRLVGFAPGLQPYEKIDLLTAYVEAMKGKHVFQAMGDPYNKKLEIPKLEPLVCEECGEKINWQILDFGTPWASAQISPTSEDYAWRDHQRQHRPPPLPEQGELGLAADD